MFDCSTDELADKEGTYAPVVARFFERRFVRASAARVFTTPEMEHEFVKWFPQCSAERHFVIPNGFDFDERVQLFRFHHLKLAQRIIGGGVIGTMGTPVEVLKQRQEHIFYKALWDVRNQITAEANARMQKQTTGHGQVG